MKRFAQIVDNKVYYVYVEKERPPFPDDVLLIDVTNKLEVQEGWDYNEITEEFTAPVISEPEQAEPRPSLEEMQAQTLLNTEYLVSLKDLGI